MSRKSPVALSTADLRDVIAARRMIAIMIKGEDGTFSAPMVARIDYLGAVSHTVHFRSLDRKNCWQDRQAAEGTVYKMPTPKGCNPLSGLALDRALGQTVEIQSIDGTRVRFHLDGYDRDWIEGAMEDAEGTLSPAYLPRRGWFLVNAPAGALDAWAVAAVIESLRWSKGAGNLEPASADALIETLEAAKHIIAVPR